MILTAMFTAIFMAAGITGFANSKQSLPMEYIQPIAAIFEEDIVLKKAKDLEVEKVLNIEIETETEPGLDLEEWMIGNNLEVMDN